jgi:pimeloyl-ACP methyl ester carboxylesterase
MKGALSIAIGTFLLVAGTARAAEHATKLDGWTYKGVGVAEKNPALKHYFWETARAPFGPFDRIALHRFVLEPNNSAAIPGRPSPDSREVLFIIPGTWDRGSTKDSDPNVSENWYFANQGYDVYSIEFRTGYVANLAADQFAPAGYGDALKATADWTYAVFREDIKACIELAKDIARTDKLFLAGRSRGGTQMYIYAAKYWQQDLKGLISLDGGGAYVTLDPTRQVSEAAFNASVAAFKAKGPYLSEVSSFEQGRLAGAVPFSRNDVGKPLPAVADLPPDKPIPPYAPAEKAVIATVSDAAAYGSFYVWGAGKVTNYYTPYPGGQGETYMEREVLVGILSNFTRYWPRIQDVEGAAMANYGTNHPYLDYVDTGDVNVPLLVFGSEFGCPNGVCRAPLPNQVTRIAGRDITTVFLAGFGHLDVYAGTHSREQVKKPMLDWMNARK